MTKGLGHNSANMDKADMDCVKDIMALKSKIADLNGKIKDRLNDHKNTHGTPKGAIRKVIKELSLTEEQYQAKKEIEAHSQHIIQLFANNDGQYSFLKNDDEKEAA